MESQIIRKQAGINPQNGDTVLKYFEVQPEDKNLERYICNVDYVVEQIDEKKESFYVNRGGEKIDVFVNHKPKAGEEFVQTKKDKNSKDNLWSLPDFEFSKDEYVRKGTPKAVLKNLIPYLLSALALGLLLPILFCWLTGGCFCGKPTSIVDTVYVSKPCPTYDEIALDTFVHFQYDKSDTIHLQNIKGEDCMATLKNCITLLTSDTLNFYVELTGYADYKGGKVYNEELASYRELSIANYFIKHGVKHRQMPFQREEGNLHANVTTDSTIQSKDRKVEIRIYGLEKK